MALPQPLRLTLASLIRLLQKHKASLILLAVVAGCAWHIFSNLHEPNTYAVDEVHYVSAAKNLLNEVFKLNVSWSVPVPSSHKGYLNLEHPPLGKWIIALALLILGDRPFYWRIPGAIMGSLMPVLAYIIGRRLGGEIAGIVSAIIVALDPMLYAMSRVAMLDIYQAFLIMLAVAALLYDRYLLFCLLSGLSVAVKLSSLFIIYGLAIYVVLVNSRRRAIIRLAQLAVLSAIAYLLVNVPLILHLGPQRWFELEIWMIEVHSSFKAEHPASAPPINPSNPLENWLLNYRPFPLTGDLKAEVSPVLTLGGLVALIIIAIREARVGVTSRSVLPLWFASGYGFYIVLYFIGRPMQFIFYMTPLTPPLDIGLGVMPSLIVLDKLSEPRLEEGG